MPKYKARAADSYGHAIGILLLDYWGPFIPGDVGNASTYGYPVLYKPVPGLTFERVLESDPDCEPLIVAAAKSLEASGVRGITSDCGFLIAYQKAVSKAVRVPVCLSSLLQLPFITQLFEEGRPVGCITATRRSLGNRVLELAGVRDNMNVVVSGMEDRPHFASAILGGAPELDSDLIEAETVEAARELQASRPNLAAIMIECSMLPPYSKAVQEATGVPVFDFITMIDYVQAAARQRAYQGIY